MVLTVMRAHYERLKPMKIQYRSYKNFYEKDFLRDLGHMPFHKCNQMRDKENAYNCFKEMFIIVVDKHAPVKTRFLRGNQAPFLNKELSKAIMHRSKLLNKFRKTKSDIDWNAYKKQRNKCVSIRRKNILEHFTKLCNNGGIANKKFWDTVKPFFTDKGTHQNQALILRENDQIMRDERKVAEVMNKYFVDIVETVSGKKPREIIGCQNNHETDQELDRIIKTFEDHLSVQSIRSSLVKIPNNLTEFNFKHPTREDIIRIINELHDKTSTGIDNIPPKLVKIASEIISDPLTELINQTLITDLKFPCLEKIARVTAVFKKEDRMKKSNYRPISVLNVFSKVFKRFLLNQMVPYLDNVLSTYLSAYRKG